MDKKCPLSWNERYSKASNRNILHKSEGVFNWLLVIVNFPGRFQYGSQPVVNTSVSFSYFCQPKLILMSRRRQLN